MSYSPEFQASWKDHRDIDYDLLIEKDGFVGSVTTIQKLETTPVQINRRSTKSDEDLIIVGSELLFNFTVPPIDISIYDPIFESNYKDYRVSFYKDGSLNWRGWVKPENFSREEIDNGDWFGYSLSATDAIADLKNIPYPTFTDRVPIMTHIERCLAETDVSLNFKIQLNTYERIWSTSTANTLVEVDANSRRFENTKDGRIFNTNCNEVLEELLRPFNVTLMQSDGYYWLVNFQEPNSYVHYKPWGTTSGSTRTASDLRIPIDDWQFNDRGSIEKIVPYKYVNLTFQNRNLGEDIVENGDFADGSTNWGVEDWTAFEFVSEFRGDVSTNGSATPTLRQNLGPFTTSVTDPSSGSKDIITVSFKHKLTEFFEENPGTDPGVYPWLRINLRKNGDSGSLVAPADSNWIIYYTGLTDWIEHTATFEIDENLSSMWLSFEYDLKYDPITNNSEFSAYIDDVIVTTVFSGGGGLTTDKYYQTTNLDKNWIQSNDRIIKFGDSIQENDVGSFQIDGSLTSSWNRYDRTDQVSIQECYSTNVIENYSIYKNYTRLKIHDDEDLLTPRNLVTLNGQNYKMVGFKENYRSGLWKEVDVEMERIIVDDVSTSFTITALTSVDGESQSSGSTSTVGPGTGAQIADDSISPLTTWSSQKIDASLNGLNFDTNWGDIGGTLSAQTDLQSALNGKEPAFSKNTAFNKNFGTSGTTVAYGNHLHTGVYEPYNLNITKDNVAETINANWRFNGTILIADTANGLAAVTGSYGTVQTTGAGKGGYQGYNINGNAAFVASSSLYGLFDDTNNDWGIQCLRNSETRLYFNGIEKLNTYTSGVQVTGNLLATGEVEAYDTSDKRLKTNIKPLNNDWVRDSLMRLNTIRYDHVQKGREEIGVIAQEVEQYFPEMVKENDEGFLMVQYSRLVVPLLNLVQSQEKRITQLEKTVDGLRNK